jgi:dipeptidyl aminopeptidase/acylaminoacyl peptidase
MYLPKNPGSQKSPCIISIHGGPEGQSTYGFEPVFQYFLNSGYAVVEPNVRGSTGYGKKYAALDNVRNRENSVRDIEYLVEYLKTRSDIDPDKIIVYGGSYGGYMVLACLTLYPKLFAAGIDVVGISSFITFLQNTADYRRKNRESEYGSLEKDYAFLEDISPINKVESISAPLLIIHGRNDPRVPVGEAQQIYDAVKNRGGEAELLIYEDEGHGLAKLKNRLDAYPKIVEFLNKYVGNK